MKVLHRLSKKKATTLSGEKLKEKKEKILGISMSCDEKIISYLPPTEDLFCLLLSRISYLQSYHRKKTIEEMKNIFCEDGMPYIDQSDLGLAGPIILNPDDTLMRDFFEKNHVKGVRIHRQAQDWMLVIVDRGTKSHDNEPLAYVVFKGTVTSQPINDDSGPMERILAATSRDWQTDLTM